MNSSTISEWTLWYPSLPITINAERAAHWSVRAKATKEWREAFWLLAKQAKIPHLNAAIIEVTAVTAKGKLLDVGNSLPSVKAAVDGLIDARVLDDDSPKFLKQLIFNASERGEPGLRLVVRAA